MTSRFKTMRVLAYNCFILLLRDKIFIPAVVIGVVFALASIMISDWSVEDFVFIVFQIIALGFHVTGGVVAMVWGSKIISESRMQGAIESQLAAPVSRSTWILGNYFGLMAALVVLWLLMITCSQAILVWYRYGWWSYSQYACLGLLGVLWLVVAAFSFFFGSFCGSAIALFGTIGAWVTGITIGVAEASISDKTPPFLASTLRSMSKFLDLNRLNLSNYLYDYGIVSKTQFMWHGLYGLSLIILLLVATCLIFEKRDLI